MKKLFQKVDQIRATNAAALKIEDPNSPYYHLNGKRFKVESMGIPDYRCRVTLLIEDCPVNFTINDIA